MKLDTILEAAKNSATEQATKDRIEEIQWCSGYAEMGYPGSKDYNGDDPEPKDVVFGNWNETDRYDALSKTRVKLPDGNILPRLFRILEKAGYSCEWLDEFATCESCNRAVRTEPNGYCWEPSYVLKNDTLLCKDCAEDDDDGKANE